MIIGRVLAWQLGAEVGDELTVMVPGRPMLSPRADGRCCRRSLVTRRVRSRPAGSRSARSRSCRLADAGELAGQGTSPAGLRLRFDDVMRAPAYAAGCAPHCPTRSEVSDWTQEHAAYFRAIRIEKTMMSLILLLVVAVAAFNIVAALVMVVNEKRSDIAILRTLGLTPRGVVGAFFTQGLVIGATGTLLGVALGLAIAYNVGHDRAGARARVRLPLHGPDRLLHHGDPVRSAGAAGARDRRGRVRPDRARDDLPRAAWRGYAPRRGAAIRVMPSSLPYELLIGRRYLRSTGNRFLSFISLISMLGVAIGVAVLIVVLSVMNGFERELRGRILSVTSHATVSAFGAGLADWRAAREKALANPEVAAAAPFVEGEALLIGEREGSGSSAASVRGILPELESQVSAVGERLESGSLAALRPGSFRVILGVELAKQLEVRRGDTVVLAIAQGSVTPAGVVPRLRRFEVEGVFASGMYEIDKTLALVHLAGRGAAVPAR